MLGFLKRAIDPTDSGVSVKRLIMLWVAILSCVLVVSIVWLCFIVALDAVPMHNNGIDAIRMLLYALIIIFVFILLLSGVIAWGDINTTAGILRGLPAAAAGAITQFKQEIKETTNSIATQTT